MNEINHLMEREPQGPLTVREAEMWTSGFRCCALNFDKTQEELAYENYLLRARCRTLRVLMGQLEARRIVPGETA